MGDEHDGLVEFMRECADHIHHIGFRFGIKVSSRLVGEHDLWPGHEGASYADALLLATRHLRRIMLHAFAKTDPLQQFSGDRLAFFFRHASKHQRHRHVFDRVEAGQQIVRLENEAQMLLPELGQPTFAQFGDRNPADDDAALGGTFHTRQLVEQCGLTGTGFAVDAADLPPWYGKVHPFQRHDGLVQHRIFLTEITYFDDRAFRRLT